MLRGSSGDSLLTLLDGKLNGKIDKVDGGELIDMPSPFIFGKYVS